ncbi:DUF6691 family protein [Maribacter sp. 2-571]|uniref:DUF6691 family protein n=1 Tax=Maribacter sp. 2-571 TaxID=3417569 RepID=UPI003D3320FD
MKFLKFLSVGILFGIILVKSEAVSWYRIYEMFRFEALHMYGIIGSAVGVGMLGLFLFKRMGVKDVAGNSIALPQKKKSVIRYLVGGSLFGLGWALAGACPGPMYVLIGTGNYSVVLLIFAALIGTFAYGLVKEKLPH